VKTVAILDRLKDEFSFIRGNILINTVSLALILVTAAIPYTYYSLYIEGLGGDAFIVGVIGFVSNIALALVQFPGGYLADKYGRRTLIYIMTFAFSITYFLFAIAPNWQIFMLVSVIQSVFLIYRPALQALVSDSTPPEKRGLGFSIVNLLHYVSFPSPLIAGILLVEFGLVPAMRISYMLLTGAFFVAAIMRMRFKETLKQTEKGMSVTSAFKTFPESVKQSISALRSAPRPMLFLFFTFAIYNFAWFTCSLNMIFYATDILNITEFNWAILMTWYSVVNLISALPCGKIIDRFGRKKPLIVAWFLFIPAMIGFVYGDLIILALCYLMLGVALILTNTAYPALLADLVVRDNRGKIIGSTNFFFSILNSLGQISGGYMYQYMSPALPFLLSAILYIPCLIITILKVQEPSERQI
jgi:DHA1 family multidrug resistance protein-like MFS transporter